MSCLFVHTFPKIPLNTESDKFSSSFLNLSPFKLLQIGCWFYLFEKKNTFSFFSMNKKLLLLFNSRSYSWFYNLDKLLFSLNESQEKINLQTCFIVVNQSYHFSQCKYKRMFLSLGGWTNWLTEDYLVCSPGYWLLGAKVLQTIAILL